MMKALCVALIVLSCALAAMAQTDPNYLAHGLYHPDIQAVVPVVGANPGGVRWANSYSVGNQVLLYAQGEIWTGRRGVSS